MNGIPGRRPDSYRDPEVMPQIMSEKRGSHLPDLDYQNLAASRLAGMRASMRMAKAPEGRFESLIAYLGKRSQGASAVNAAEVDRRLRTWFEDLINRILQDPAGWDQEMTLNGKTLMDYLAGSKEPAQEPPQP